MSGPEYYKQMGRTKRELYRKWAQERKACSPCSHPAAVQYYLPPYRDCTKAFITQQIAGQKGVSAFDKPTYGTAPEAVDGQAWFHPTPG